VLVWLGLAFILAGLAWSYYFIRLHRRAVAQAEAARTWPMARGVVVENAMAMEESSDSEGTTTQWFTPQVRYSFEVGSRTHEGDRIRFGSLRTADRKKAEGWAAPYPAGGSCTVRYNPLDPADCVLETSKPSASYLTASLVGLVFIGLGLFALL